MSDKKRHVHADLIHAWAEGAEIEMRRPIDCKWLPCTNFENPGWSVTYEYRIKPTPKPDVVIERAIIFSEAVMSFRKDADANLRLTFDGETGKLKSAEAI